MVSGIETTHIEAKTLVDATTRLRTTIAAENIGFDRVGDKTYTIGRVMGSQDEGIYRSHWPIKIIFENPRIRNHFSQDFHVRHVTELLNDLQTDSGIL